MFQHKFRFFLLLLLPLLSFSQNVIKGIVYDEDSLHVLPFAYVINKNTQFGSVSDVNGTFTIKASEKDTIIFSYMSYIKMAIPVVKLNQLRYKVIMRKNTYMLNTVNVSVLKLQNYEKDYMKRVIDKSQMPTIDAIQSPITALYMQFSKKGREMQKLSKIFEDIFIQEQVNKKINPHIMYQLTGEPNIDVDALKKYCGYYLSDYFILNHDGYDLYSKVLECYYRYKYEKEN